MNKKYIIVAVFKNHVDWYIVVAQITHKRNQKDQQRGDFGAVVVVAYATEVLWEFVF